MLLSSSKLPLLFSSQMQQSDKPPDPLASPFYGFAVSSPDSALKRPTPESTLGFDGGCRTGNSSRSSVWLWLDSFAPEDTLRLFVSSPTASLLDSGAPMLLRPVLSPEPPGAAKDPDEYLLDSPPFHRPQKPPSPPSDFLESALRKLKLGVGGIVLVASEPLSLPSRDKRLVRVLLVGLPGVLRRTGLVM